MIRTSDWETPFQKELDQAQAARSQGNEGKARVCARRAAGLLIAEYLQRRGLAQPGPSAYDQIRCLDGLAGLPPGVREVASHLLVRINPDRSLPVQADLIAEVKWLKDALLS